VLNSLWKSSIKLSSKKSDTLQAYLSSPEDALFPGYLQLLVEERLSEEAFLQFQSRYDERPTASPAGSSGCQRRISGVCRYTEMDRRVLSIFLVRDTEGIVFKKEKEQASFVLNDVTYSQYRAPRYGLSH
jgi:hypothetical protein